MGHLGSSGFCPFLYHPQRGLGRKEHTMTRFIDSLRGPGLTAALFFLAFLAACNPQNGERPVTSAPAPAATEAPSATVAFPTAAQVAAGRVIESITANTSIGAYGRPARVTRNPECGFVREAVSTSPLAVSSPLGPVSISFDLGGCTRTHTDRGVPYALMTKVIMMASGAYLEGTTLACWLPNVGTPSCRSRHSS
jgi:hypothetical protein